MPLSIDSYLGLHAKAMELRSERANVIASNLANSDTPNYKAKDLDFKSVLEAQAGSGMQLARTNLGHLSLGGGTGQTGEMKYRVPNAASLDGNTVDTHVEQSNFSENAIRYQASMELLNSKITGIIKTLRSE